MDELFAWELLHVEAEKNDEKWLSLNVIIVMGLTSPRNTQIVGSVFFLGESMWVSTDESNT